MRISLTDEQAVAATSGELRSYVEAGPGSGKTVVAAARFGVKRFGPQTPGKGVLAVSFARSARRELERRVDRRWGSNALRWPHRVWTLDTLHCKLVEHLLRVEALHWPGGHKELVVLDSWRGFTGSRPLDAGDFSRHINVRSGRVVIEGGRRRVLGYGFTRRDQFLAHLRAGICTHEDVRRALDGSLQDPEIREALRDYLMAATSALIVDEVFDGNATDLAVVRLAAELDIPTTVIGDPWQALYGFRGARPDLVPLLIQELGFLSHPVTHSFRFRTAAMQSLARELRNGAPVTVVTGTAEAADVVLASEWQALWLASPHVLPQAFGQANNRTDAALALLLQHVARRSFGEVAQPGADPAIMLGLDPAEVHAQAGLLFDPVLERLQRADGSAASDALRILRQNLRAAGSVTLRALSAPNEATRVDRLRALATRLSVTPLVPAMTVHQAKGLEWDRVAVVLTPAQEVRLRAGLGIESEVDRVLYVAFTRARDEAWRIT